VAGLPTPTGEGLTVGFTASHAGSASAEVIPGMLSAKVFGPSWATKASDRPERLPPPVRGEMVGKLPAVSPVTYVFSDESSAMLVPTSFPDPPK
jgi:hypothetical protein